MQPECVPVAITWQRSCCEQSRVSGARCPVAFCTTPAFLFLLNDPVKKASPRLPLYAWCRSSFHFPKRREPDRVVWIMQRLLCSTHRDGVASCACSAENAGIPRRIYTRWNLSHPCRTGDNFAARTFRFRCCGASSQRSAQRGRCGSGHHIHVFRFRAECCDPRGTGQKWHGAESRRLRDRCSRTSSDSGNSAIVVADAAARWIAEPESLRCSIAAATQSSEQCAQPRTL